MRQDSRKIALITGSSRGLGKNTALALAKKGVDVIVTYRSSEAEAQNVVSEIEEIGGKAIALQLDTSLTETFDDFVVQIKGSLQDKWQTEQFDFLVNNAGIGIHAPFAETTDIGGAIAKRCCEAQIASLLSQENRWVNAQRIEVSGGMFL